MAYALLEANRTNRTTGQSPLSSAISRLVQRIGRFLEVRRGWREMTRLAQLDDRMLTDIGVSRGDLNWALMQPWGTDPSHALALKIERRKCAAQWARGFQAR